MRPEKKADRALKEAAKFENEGTRADSSFFHLIHRDTTKTGSKLAADGQNRKMLASRKSLHNSLSAFVSDSIPCSLLACILALPENPVDWSTFSDLLITLLAERGWSFLEALPTAEGQLPMAEYLAIVSDRHPYAVRQEALWSETKAISKAWKTFERYYQELGVHTTMEQLERIVDPQTPGFFRRCIMGLLEDERLPYIINVITSDSGLMNFCRERWNLTAQQLNFQLTTDGLQEYSLADVLSKLLSICAEISKDIRTTIQKFETPVKFSAEAYARYCQSKKIQRDLEDKLKSKSLLYCSSAKHLPSYLKWNLIDVYEHVDVIKRDDRSPEEYEEDLRFRLNGHRKADETSKIPRLFSFSWIDTSPKTIKPQLYNTLKVQLCDNFRAYRERLGVTSEISDGCLEQNIENILLLSLMPMFSVREDDTGDIEDTAVTLAPIIVYSIFHWDDLINKQPPLKEIPTHFLFPRVQEQKAPAVIAADMWLFSNLCRSYQGYYRDRYSEALQEEWNAAFLVYSKYGRLYGNPGLLCEVERELGRIEGVVFPHSPYFRQITACLYANRVIPAHGVPAWKQERIALFHPHGPDDPGWSAVADLRQLLEKDRAQSSEPWLEQFWQKYLLYGYTPVDIFVFLKRCFRDLSRLPNGQSIDYQSFVDQYGLLSIYNNSAGRHLSSESITLATLEYTMRLVLEERCCVRLHRWLDAFIDYKLDNTDCVD